MALNFQGLMKNLANLIPITFGITGHRDIHPDDQIRAAGRVHDAVKSFRARHPNTPFIFISPLAQGADIIAAEAALSADHTNNTFLYVVIPYQLDLYKKSISSEWHDRFDDLLNRSTGLNILNILSDEGDEAKNSAYQTVGEFVAIYSHILFVMKSAQQLTHGEEGTAGVVDFRNAGCVNLRDITEANLNHAEDGLVYEIRVRKSDEPSLAPTNNDDLRYITPVDLTSDAAEEKRSKALAKKRFQGSLKVRHPVTQFVYRLFNIKQASYAEVEIELFNKALLRQQLANEIIVTADQLPMGWSGFLERVAKKADSLSGDNQKFFSRHFSLIIILALIATLSQTLQETFEIFPEGLTLAMKAIPLGLAVLVYLHAEYSKYKSKYESFRSLSEGLKVQAFWSRAQVQESAADYFLVGDFGPSSWVRRALRSCRLVDLISAKEPKRNQEYYEELERVRIDWLTDDRLLYDANGEKVHTKGQIPWLAQKIATLREHVERVETRIKWCSGIWLASYLFASVIDLPFMSEFKPIIGPYTKYIQFFGLFPLIAMAMYKHYIDGRGFGVTYKRYLPLHHFFLQSERLLSQLLANARSLKRDEGSKEETATSSKGLGTLTLDEKLRKLFKLVGIAALGEVSDWYISNSRVTIQNPVGKE